MATAQPAFGGNTLRSGAAGPDVALVQTWLNGVRSRWPGIERVAVDGHFGPATLRAVKAFQTAAGLNADGDVGPATWAALGAAYAAANGPGEVWPGITLRQGHTGATVKSAQEKLKALVPDLAADGRYGPATRDAVYAYQVARGLNADGLLGRRTWGALYG